MNESRNETAWPHQGGQKVNKNDQNNNGQKIMTRLKQYYSSSGWSQVIFIGASMGCQQVSVSLSCNTPTHDRHSICSVWDSQVDCKLTSHPLCNRLYVVNESSILPFDIPQYWSSTSNATKSMKSKCQHQRTCSLKCMCCRQKFKLTFKLASIHHMNGSDAQHTCNT